jgi:hypothetical protein
MKKISSKRSSILRLNLLPMLIITCASIARSDESSDGSGHVIPEAAKKCFASAGVSAPTPGTSPPQLTDTQKQSLTACFTANGITPPTGGPRGGHPPSQEQMEKIQACFQKDGMTFSRPQPGQEPSDADKAEFKKCHAQSED